MKDNTAQSEVIGIVLILGISIASIGVILLLGQPVLTDATDGATIDRVQNEMRTLDSRLTAASVGTSVNETLRLNLEGGELTTDSDSGNLNVTLADGTRIYNEEIGKIEYDKENTALAYEGGGVWRRNTLTNASSMVAPPDFDFDGETLTLPVYNVTTDSGYSGTQILSVRGGNNTRYHPNSTTTNPVGGVILTVQTDYYEAWRRYLEDEIGGNVTVKENAGEVRAELSALDTPDSIEWAGVSEKEYETPSNELFDSFEEGVKFRSVDSTIESYLDYAESNIDSSAVADLNASGSTYDDRPGVYYNNTDYTMDNSEDFDISGGNVTVVVDGDLTVENPSVSGSNTVRVVTTGDLEFTDSYDVNTGGNPGSLVFYAPSGSEVSLNDGNTGEGIIYAPDAFVSLSDMGSSTWTGSIVAEVIDANGVDAGASVDFGSPVGVERADERLNLYLTERQVGIE